MNAYRVPKERAVVDVTYLDGTTARLTVFLAESAAHHQGPERLSDLLSGWNDFIPAEDDSPDRILWFNRMNVGIVRSVTQLDPDEAQFTIPSEEDVTVTLATGAQVRGLVTYVRPPNESRLTDVLNDGLLFLRLVDQSQVVFINKRHIARVVSHKE